MVRRFSGVRVVTPVFTSWGRVRVICPTLQCFENGLSEVYYYSNFTGSLVGVLFRVWDSIPRLLRLGVRVIYLSPYTETVYLKVSIETVGCVHTNFYIARTLDLPASRTTKRAWSARTITAIWDPTKGRIANFRWGISRISISKVRKLNS